MRSVVLAACVLLAAPWARQAGARQAGARQAGGPANVDPKRWESLDIESRWLLYRQTGNSAAARKQAWVKWLAKREEWQLLEWIVIYDGYSVAGPELEERDPRWIRCAVWSANHPDSHTVSEARTALQTKSSKLVWSWLRRYRKVLTPPLAKIYAKLEGMKLDEVDITPFPPPLDTTALLAPLDKPRHKLHVLAVGQKLDPDKLYAHQVERAFDALVNSGHRSLAWQLRVLAWGRHKNPILRRTALLSLTKLSPSPSLRKPLLSIVKGASEPEDVKAALMSASYIVHPQIWLFLHHVARSPNHPGFRVALSRLGGTGNRFTVELLQGLDRDGAIARSDLGFVAQELNRLRQRATGLSLLKKPERVRAMLERVAWAELHEDSLASQLKKWTTGRIRGAIANPNVKRTIDGLAAGYAPVANLGTDEQRAKIAETVRTLARSIQQE